MRTLISREQIAGRLPELAREIEADFAAGPGDSAAPEGSLVVVGVLTGAVIFLADLVRELRRPTELAFVTASSYGGGTTAGNLSLDLRGLPPIAGRDVLLVDDIFDTGQTLGRLIERLAEQSPARLLSTVLLRKAIADAPPCPARVGFEIPPEFVVGYGLDYGGLYRDLPDIAVLEPHEIDAAR